MPRRSRHAATSWKNHHCFPFAKMVRARHAGSPRENQLKLSNFWHHVQSQTRTDPVPSVPPRLILAHIPRWPFMIHLIRIPAICLLPLLPSSLALHFASHINHQQVPQTFYSSPHPLPMFLSGRARSRRLSGGGGGQGAERGSSLHLRPRCSSTEWTGPAGRD